MSMVVILAAIVVVVVVVSGLVWTASVIGIVVIVEVVLIDARAEVIIFWLFALSVSNFGDVLSSMLVDILVDAVTDVIMGMVSDIGVELLSDANANVFTFPTTALDFAVSKPLEDSRAFDDRPPTAFNCAFVLQARMPAYHV